MDLRYQQDLLALKRNYAKTNKIGKIFFPRKLAHLIETYSEESSEKHAFKICREIVYGSNFLWIKKAFSCLERFKESELGKTLKHFQRVVFHKTSGFDNFSAIIAHNEPQKVARGLEVLQNAGLLETSYAEQNRKAIQNAEEPLDNTVKLLERASSLGLLKGFFKQTNFRELRENPSPLDAVYIYSRLRELKILTVKNRNLVIAQENIPKLKKAMILMRKKGMLNGAADETNFQIVAQATIDNIEDPLSLLPEPPQQTKITKTNSCCLQ